MVGQCCVVAPTCCDRVKPSLMDASLCKNCWIGRRKSCIQLLFCATADFNPARVRSLLASFEIRQLRQPSRFFANCVRIPRRSAVSTRLALLLSDTVLDFHALLALCRFLSALESCGVCGKETMLLELVGSIVHCRSSGVALMNAIREDWDPRRITTPLVAVVRSVAKAGSMRMVDLWEELDLRPPPVTTFSVGCCRPRFLPRI